MILAIVFAALLGLLMLLQLFLALGAPWGRFAWGGGHPGVLPVPYRIASAASSVVYVIVALLALDLGGLVDVVPNGVARIGMWVVFGLLVLSVAMNAISRSRAERLTMTPLALALAILSFFIALTGPVARVFEGMVLDQGDGPVFCTVIMESYPPQCGGDALVVLGWDWDTAVHERSPSIRWGLYRFDGIRDGGTITVAGAPESR